MITNKITPLTVPNISPISVATTAATPNCRPVAIHAERLSKDIDNLTDYHRANKRRPVRAQAAGSACGIDMKGETVATAANGLDQTVMP